LDTGTGCLLCEKKTLGKKNIRERSSDTQQRQNTQQTCLLVECLLTIDKLTCLSSIFFALGKDLGRRVMEKKHLTMRNSNHNLKQYTNLD
jgi:hypothetical protein